MTNFIPTEKAEILAQQYLEMFGKGIVRCYLFPAIPRDDMISFLNSVRIILNRHNLRPMYVWQHDLNRDQYRLVLFSSAYFHTAESSDVNSLLHRLWSIRSYQPFQCIRAELLEPVNAGPVMEYLRDFMTLDSQSSFSWHQRSFGTSRLNPYSGFIHCPH